MSKNYRPFYHKNRNQESVSLGDALKQMFSHFGLEDKLESVSIASIWKETMGNFIADRTKKIWIRENTLHVSVTSSTLRHEMQLNKLNIMKMINEQLGRERITELKVY